MSTAKQPHDQGIVPFQPIDVGDRQGLSSAVYAINALFLRSGKEPLQLPEVRTRIAALINDADADKLALMLQEWYLEVIDVPAAKELLDTLPAMIEADDNERYKHNPIVNDIEWRALATIYRCCIAVKFLTDRNLKPLDVKQIPGWKIAVPTPKIFGLKSMPGAAAAGNSCVFMVCHSSPKLSTYVALIPCDQKIFAPGRSLLGNDRTVQVPVSQTQPPVQAEKVDNGVDPSVRFEGYVASAGDGEDVKLSKHVTFAADVDAASDSTIPDFPNSLRAPAAEQVPEPAVEPGSEAGAESAAETEAAACGCRSGKCCNNAPTQPADEVKAPTQSAVKVKAEISSKQLEVPPAYETVTEQIVDKPETVQNVDEPSIYETEPEQVVGRSETGEDAEIPPAYEMITKQAVVQPESSGDVVVSPVHETVTENVLVQTESRIEVEVPLALDTLTEQTVVQPEVTGDAVVPAVSEQTDTRIDPEASQEAQEVVEDVVDGSTTVTASEEVAETAPVASQATLTLSEKTPAVMTNETGAESDAATVNERTVEENDHAKLGVSPETTPSGPTAKEPRFEAMYVKTPQFVPRTRGGRTELEIGELSDATILFQRVYNGAKRAPTAMHGKVTQTAESMHDVFTKMYGAVH